MKLDPQVCVFREGTVPVEFGTTLGFRHPLGDLRPSTPWIRGATVVLLLLRTVAFLWPEILQTSVDCFLLCILLDFTFSQLKKKSSQFPVSGTKSKVSLHAFPSIPSSPPRPQVLNSWGYVLLVLRDQPFSMAAPRLTWLVLVIKFVN